MIGGEMVDFEAPGAIVFELENNDKSKPLMLSDLISQFTQIDLSDVPVLNAIGFDELGFWMVDDPAGFKIGEYTFPPGIGVVTDLFVYSWEAKFNLQVSWGQGIIAAGSINEPIALGGIFTLSDTTGLKGPSGSINTSAMAVRAPRVQAHTRLLPRTLVPRAAAPGATPYFTLDGMVKFLGIAESVLAQASVSSFDFQLSFAFFDIVTSTLNCALVDDKSFSGATSVGFDLDVTLGPYSVDGITLIPQVRIDAPAAALILGIAINPTVIAQLSVGLKFSWSSLLTFDFDVTITLSDIASDLKTLFSAVIQWMEDNVGAVFANVLSDVNAWIDAVKSVFTDLAGNIDAVANALANYFKTAAVEAAAFLKALGFAFEPIVNALVNYFKIAFNEAVKIVEGLWNDCSMTNAYTMTQPGGLAGVSVKDLMYSFIGCASGRRLLLLLLRYGHGDEIWRLLAHRPELRQRLAALDASPQGANDLKRLLDTVLSALTEVAPRAAPVRSAGAETDGLQMRGRAPCRPCRRPAAESSRWRPASCRTP